MDILELVKDYDVVTIFRHQVADQDALGSQFGLKYFIQEFYPDKKVFALGNDLGGAASLFPKIDQIEDELVENSIAFILDTANIERVDDARCMSAKKKIKIDHHIVVDEFADESLVETNAAATCEIIADLIKKSNFKISSQCAKYLYYGLLSDSNNFTTTNTTPNTLKAASYLVSCGLNVNEILQERNGISLNEYHYMNEIRQNSFVDGHVIYAIMNHEMYEKYGMTYNEAKEKVFVMSNIDEIEMWCLFTEDTSYEHDRLYNGSLRSKKIAIDKVANEYRGGGHKNACGVKKLSLEDIKLLIEDFNKLVKAE